MHVEVDTFCEVEGATLGDAAIIREAECTMLEGAVALCEVVAAMFEDAAATCEVEGVMPVAGAFNWVKAPVWDELESGSASPRATPVNLSNGPFVSHMLDVFS